MLRASPLWEPEIDDDATMINTTSADSKATSHPMRQRSLEIAALGVAFGDIGTNPLFAFDLALKAAAELPLEVAVLRVLLTR